MTIYFTQDKFSFCKAEEWDVAVATSIDDNAADGNLDKWNRLLIAVAYTGLELFILKIIICFPHYGNSYKDPINSALRKIVYNNFFQWYIDYFRITEIIYINIFSKYNSKLNVLFPHYGIYKLHIAYYHFVIPNKQND